MTLSDTLHNLADSSAIFIAFLAGKCSRKKPDKYRTFGYQRQEFNINHITLQMGYGCCLGNEKLINQITT